MILKNIFCWNQTCNFVENQVLILAKMDVSIKGKVIDDYTRCSHYHSELDIIAIKFKCCDTYFPCYECHQETENHLPKTWNKSEFNKLAILCGECKQEMSINQYLNSEDSCPYCKASFNPKCKNHYHLYFET